MCGLDIYDLRTARIGIGVYCHVSGLSGRMERSRTNATLLLGIGCDAGGVVGDRALLHLAESRK